MVWDWCWCRKGAVVGVAVGGAVVGVAVGGAVVGVAVGGAVVGVAVGGAGTGEKFAVPLLGPTFIICVTLCPMLRSIPQEDQRL